MENDIARAVVHDPFHDREIEVKLEISQPSSPSAVLDEIASQLQRGDFYPFVYDGFGFPMCRIRNFVFGRQRIDGAIEEAFVVIHSERRGYSVRVKSAVNEAATAIGGVEGWIFDRREQEAPISADHIDDLLEVIAQHSDHGHRPVVYIGEFERELGCIASLNVESGHRYAIIADVCRAARAREDLRQVEIEYIWKRAAFGRAFDKSELYHDIARLAISLTAHYGARGLTLELSRRTKFAWLLGADGTDAKRPDHEQ